MILSDDIHRSLWQALLLSFPNRISKKPMDQPKKRHFKFGPLKEEDEMSEFMVKVRQGQ